MRTAKTKRIPKLGIRREDQVQVIAGKAKGESGEVLRLDNERQQVWVKGVNIQMRHTKPRGQGDRGGIIESEGPLHYSNVLLFCSNCQRGVRTRIQVVDKQVKNRICARCGETIR